MATAPSPERRRSLVERKRLLKFALLVAGVAGLVIAANQTISEAHGRVLPSPRALAIGAGLAFVTVLGAARSWSALFGDVLSGRAEAHRLRGTYYLAQLTKYVPAAGGFVQATSQVGMAAATGLPLGQVAVALPAASLCAVAAGCFLGAGLVFSGELPVWARALAPLGLLVPVLLDRRVLAWFLGLARRIVKRIPTAEKLPPQRRIVVAFGWALVTLAATSANFTVLVRSLSRGANPLLLFCAYAFAWVVGYVAVPVPAGIGIREAVVVAAVPGVNTGVLIAASLALRLLALGAELAATAGNRLASRLVARLGSRAAGRTDQAPIEW